MLAEKRREQLVEQLNATGSIRVDEMAKRFNVTEDCIRKDLTILEKEGMLKKVYGGAVPVRNHPHTYSSYDREKEESEERDIIANKAYALIKEDEKIYLDVSVTSVRIARLLRENPKKITVITNMISVLIELADVSEIKVIFLGGEINEQRDAFWSSATFENLRRVHIDAAFLGTVGVDIQKNDLSTYFENDAMLKHQVITQSKKSYVLAESKKFQSDGDYNYATLDEIDGIISGIPLSKEIQKSLTKRKVEIL